MAEPEKKPVVLQEGEVAVPSKQLTQILENQAMADKKIADLEAKNAGLQEMFASKANTTGEEKLRERKSFEPAFRVAGIKKYPIAGDIEKLGYVIGWTNRGAYQKVDRSGVAPIIVDYIDVVYLGHEKNAEGKLQAESIPLLSLMNAAEVICKVLDVKKETRKQPTGEEISVSVWDPKHGLVDSGEKIDGWVAFTDMTYTIQVPGLADPVTIDSKFLNI